MASSEYVVLVSLDNGANWARYGGRDGTVKAGTGRSACEAVRRESPELHGNERAQFYAEPAARFKPQSKRKQLVEKWDWGEPEIEAQGELGT